MKEQFSSKTGGKSVIQESVELPRLAEFLKVIVARFDPQFRHTYVNNAVESATGRPVSDFIGKTNQDLGMPTELVKQWNDQLSGVFSSGLSSESRFAYRSPTGLRHFIARCAPEFGADGRVASVVALSHDVTVVTALRDKVRILESQVIQGDLHKPPTGSPMSDEIAAEYYRAIVQSSDDAIISKTLQGVVTSWNPAAKAIFGYSSEEMLGKSLMVLIPPEKNYEESFILERIQAGETVDHFETTRIHKDGRRVEVSVTTSPIRDKKWRDYWRIKNSQRHHGAKNCREAAETYRQCVHKHHRRHFDCRPKRPHRRHQ